MTELRWPIFRVSAAEIMAKSFTLCGFFTSISIPQDELGHGSTYAWTLTHVLNFLRLFVMLTTNPNHVLFTRTLRRSGYQNLLHPGSQDARKNWGKSRAEQKWKGFFGRNYLKTRGKWRRKSGNVKSGKVFLGKVGGNGDGSMAAKKLTRFFFGRKSGRIFCKSGKLKVEYSGILQILQHYPDNV